MNNDSIKKAIRQRRKALGRTQAWMAEQLGIEERTYKLVESYSGTRLLYGRMEEIARALDTTLPELMEDGQAASSLLMDDRNGNENRLADLRLELAEVRAEADKLRREVERLNGCIDDKDFIIRHLRAEIAQLKSSLPNSEE